MKQYSEAEIIPSPSRSGIAVSFFSLLVGVVIWELAGRLAGIRFLPPLSRVLVAVIDLTINGQIITYLAASLLSLLRRHQPPSRSEL